MDRFEIFDPTIELNNLFNNIYLMKTIQYILLIIIIAIFCQCTKKANLRNFDALEWKKDVKACNGTRLIPSDTLFSQRDQLLGLVDSDIIDYLGKPDAQDLDERNVKYLYYYYAPGIQCNSENEKGRHYIRFRLNSISLVSEIIKL